MSSDVSQILIEKLIKEGEDNGFTVIHTEPMFTANEVVEAYESGKTETKNKRTEKINASIKLAAEFCKILDSNAKPHEILFKFNHTESFDFLLLISADIFYSKEALRFYDSVSEAKRTFNNNQIHINTGLLPKVDNLDRSQLAIEGYKFKYLRKSTI